MIAGVSRHALFDQHYGLSDSRILLLIMAWLSTVGFSSIDIFNDSIAIAIIIFS
jgi:hypothetical protein